MRRSNEIFNSSSSRGEFAARRFCSLAPVQKNYGDTGQRNFEIKKKAYEGPPILHPSVQTSSSEPIAMVGNDISL